jgi:DNA-binding GntR family transcriptional regulator
LEGEAANLAAGHLNESGLLETLAERMPSPLDNSDPSNAARWIEADRRFHIALAQAAGNHQLVEALEPILEKSARLLHLVLALQSSVGAVTHNHDGLLAALGSRDKERAKQLIVEQIQAMEDAVVRAMTSSQSLLTANVVVNKPNNQFYLDVSPMELRQRQTDGAAGQPSARRPIARNTNPKSRVGVKQ